ncbi:MAG TPA: selenium-binding protein SBP56-related protein [Chloroflexota bacterium]|nr:selenium-binding protein SBP56-related protein [Chloroflexota bacterium]
MARVTPDPTFYPSPRSAMQAAPEQLAYVVVLNVGANGARKPDALVTVDVQPGSASYGKVVGRLDMPNIGDELHHFGWNACSSALCPYAPHPHIERRYLVVPGLRSSRIHIVDTHPDPRQPKLVKVIEPEEVARKTGYSRPHTSHCGPDGIYMSALGAPNGEGPGGVFVLDHESFEVQRAWEAERGPQYLAYDFWWHLVQDVLISSEWGTPSMVENGVNPELLLAGKYGHQLHIWDLRSRKHVQALDLGVEQQMALELRPAHDPTRSYGFVNSVVSLKDLSSSIWVWHRDNGTWRIQKVIEVPAVPVSAEQLPPALQPFGAVPPLVTDINLTLDDRFLYVSCWGSGEMRQYDVSDPFAPRLTATVPMGGIVERSRGLNGGPQMVEVSRDGNRVYVSNSLYAAWDAQFYPEGIKGWVAKMDASPAGGLEWDDKFFLEFEEGERPHQIHLEGGDASSDSYCFP